MDLNQTSDQMEMFGYTAEGAQQEADKFVEEAGDLETDISNAASFLVPFYDSGVNISNVVQEYRKPEQERDYEYIKDQFKEAGQSAAIEGGLLLMGGVAGKYGAKGIKALADKVKQYEINPNVMSAFGAGVISKKPFKKTRKAYKLFIQRDGKLYPLFVNAADEVPIGKFLEADFPKTAFKGKRTSNSEEMVYVPTKGAKRTKGEKAKGTGDLVIIPDKKTADKLREEGFTIVTPKDKKAAAAAPFGKVLAVKGRPGWHASQKPVATHLGPEDLIIDASEKKQLLDAGIPKEAFKEKTFNYLNGKLISADDVKKLSKKEKQKVKTVKKFYVKRRAEDQVFAEVDMADDVDYESMLKSEGKKDINDRVPKGGSYRYQDGQADSDFWIVGGDMKVNRILTREETKAAQKELGVKDLPYRDEVESILGRKFNKGGLAGDIMYTGDEDYKVTSSYGEDEMQMNKGGAVDGQMQMAFMNEGGIADDGMDVDPVSGNEVPPGSLAEEVRDDIPAQLSEGEYVVPADVVRYYGVKFFEDLRDEAKRGLAQMEADGRIGGEPVPDGGPVNDKELSEQEMAAIREVMGMAEGGEVQNPYLQQQQLYSQPRPAPIDEKRNTTITNVNPVENQMPMQSMASGGQVQGYQDSGDVMKDAPSFVQNQFDPSVYGLGYSFMGQPQQAGTTTTQAPTGQTFTVLYHPDYATNGRSKTFYLPRDNEIYQKYLGMGYTKQMPMTGPAGQGETPTTDTPVTTDLTGSTVTTGSGPEGSGGGGGTTPTPEKIDYTTYSPEQLLEAFDKNRKTRIALTALGAVNPLIALFGQGATRAQEKEILAAMKEKGVKPPEDEGGLVDNITNFVSGLFGKDKEEVKRKLPPQTVEQFGKSTTREARNIKPSKNISDKRKGSGMGKSTVKSTVDSRSGKRIYTSGAKPVRSQTGADTSAAGLKSAKESLKGRKVNIGGRSEGGLMNKKGKKK